MTVLARLRVPLPAPLALDLALGIALAAWWLTAEGTLGPVGAAALLLVTVPLGWRRTAPLAAALAVAAGFALSGAPEDAAEPLASLVAVLVAPYSAAAHLATRPAVAALAIVLAAGAVEDRLAGDGDWLFFAVLIGAAWTAGRITHRGRAETLRARSAAAADAQAAVAEERERIARELHDVVSHSVSLMVVHAGAAEQVLDTDPDAARRSLVTVRETGREAVDDLHRMLGLLRGKAISADAAPQPALDRLDALVAAVRDAGTPVTLETVGDAPRLTGGAGLAAYRIVQEGLTNASRHAPGRPTEVRVVHEPGRLRLDLRTVGARGAARAPGTGHGLVGIRERAALFGGRADAGWEGDDFVVRAQLEVPAA